MANDAAMAKFLYAIIKQLDLKSIDWNKVSEEMTITNGHAARMRYSRFKQQMEGHAPVRRPRNPIVKRGPKQKRPKDEQKAESDIKTEQSSSADDQVPIPMNSPENFHVGASPGSGIVPTPEAEILKSEPADDAESSQISAFDYSIVPLDMDMQMVNMQSQILSPVSAERAMGYDMGVVLPPSPHDHGMYQSMMQSGMIDHSHNQQRYYVNPYMEMYGTPTSDDMRSREHMVVKAEERWDQSYHPA